MGYKIYPNLTCLIEGTTENIGEVFITKKFTQCERSCALKINVFEIPDNKNIGKLFVSWINLISFLIHLKY